MATMHPLDDIDVFLDAMRARARGDDGLRRGRGAARADIDRLRALMPFAPPRLYLGYLDRMGVDDGGLALGEGADARVEALARFYERNRAELGGQLPARCAVIAAPTLSPAVALRAHEDGDAEPTVVEVADGRVRATLACSFHHYLYRQGLRWARRALHQPRARLTHWNPARAADAAQLARLLGFAALDVSDAWQFAGERGDAAAFVMQHGDGFVVELFATDVRDLDALAQEFHAIDGLDAPTRDGGARISVPQLDVAGAASSMQPPAHLSERLDDFVRFAASVGPASRVGAWAAASDDEVARLTSLWRGPVPALYASVLRAMGRGDGGMRLGGDDALDVRELTRCYQQLLGIEPCDEALAPWAPGATDVLAVSRRRVPTRLLTPQGPGGAPRRVAAPRGDGSLRPCASSFTHWLYRRAWASARHERGRDLAFDVAREQRRAVERLASAHGCHPLFFSDEFQYSAEGGHGAVTLVAGDDEWRLFVASRDAAWRDDFVKALLALDDVFEAPRGFGEAHA